MTPLKMHVAYFGTWERGYPRNEQVISALRMVGVEVTPVHVDLWKDEHKFKVGLKTVPRLLAAEARLAARALPRNVDAVVVGYPGQLDIWAARRHEVPVVFNAMVSLFDTFVDDRRRFSAESPAGRVLHAIDRFALRGADVVVADTAANADYLADLAKIQRPAVCYVGAEERLFRPAWRRRDDFFALFVGKLIPLHGVDVILQAALALPDIRFRLIGSGQLNTLMRDLPPNVEHIPWVEYELLPKEYAQAGCALGVFGSSDKAQRVIPNKAFQALAVGTPFVTAATAGVKELLLHGRDALLTEQNSASLSAAIRRLRDDADLAVRIGAAGRWTFERQASERVLGERWRNAIEAAVTRRRQKAVSSRL